MSSKFLAFGDNTIENPSSEKFRLHVHDNYEILLFLEGDCKFVVEENVYDLIPCDIIIIKKNQLHRVYHNSSARYRRIVLNIPSEFFVANKCREYESKFLATHGEMGNKIDAKTVKESGLYDAIMRAKKYTGNFDDCSSPIAVACVTEILYLIHKTKIGAKPVSSNGQMKEIIEYLNDNFMDNITLEMLERRFFISKYHLCHVFPEATGLTVHQYMTKKRLAYANELIKSGKTANFAADAAGFNNYSSFYRSYVNEYGISPSAKKSGEQKK